MAAACAQCEREIDAELAFCTGCGATTAELPAVPAPTPACPRCDAELDADDAFCRRCGAATAELPAITDPADPDDADVDADWQVPVVPRCGRCRELLEHDDAFCPGCGLATAELPAVAAAATSGCAVCGEEPQPGAAFCDRCGARTGLVEAITDPAGARAPHYEEPAWAARSATPLDERFTAPAARPPLPPVPPLAPAPLPTRPQHGRRRVVVAVVVGALLVAAGVGGAVFLFGDDAQQSAKPVTVTAVRSADPADPATGGDAAPSDAAPAQSDAEAAEPQANAEPAEGQAPPADAAAAGGEQDAAAQDAEAFAAQAAQPVAQLTKALHAGQRAMQAAAPTEDQLQLVRAALAAQLAASDRARADANLVDAFANPEAAAALTDAAAAQTRFLGLAARAATSSPARARALLLEADVAADEAVAAYKALFAAAPELPDEIIGQRLFATTTLRQSVEERAERARRAAEQRAAQARRAAEEQARRDRQAAQQSAANAPLNLLGSNTCYISVPSGWRVVALDENRSNMYWHNEVQSPDGHARIVCDADMAYIDGASLASRVYGFHGDTPGYQEIFYGPTGYGSWEWTFTRITDGRRVRVTDRLHDGGAAVLVQVPVELEGVYGPVLQRVLDSYGGNWNLGD